MKRQQLFDISEISAGSIVFVSDAGVAQSLIRFYEKMEDFDTWFDSNRFLPHHCQIYMGDGNCMSAEANGFVDIPITKRFTRSSAVVVASKLILSPEKLDGIKDFCLGAKGKPYDYGAVLNFVMRTISWIPGIKQLVKNKFTAWDWAVFCSEVLVQAFDCEKIKISDRLAELTTPNDILRYISGDRYVFQNDITTNGWQFRILWQ